MGVNNIEYGIYEQEKSISRYGYTPPECRASKDRHPRLLAELEELDADIFCLQVTSRTMIQCQPWDWKEMDALSYLKKYFKNVLLAGGGL